MKLHISTVEKLIRLYDNYGGHRNETKLKSALAELDLSLYERSSGESIIVLTDDLQKEQADNTRK